MFYSDIIGVFFFIIIKEAVVAVSQHLTNNDDCKFDFLWGNGLLSFPQWAYWDHAPPNFCQ